MHSLPLTPFEESFYVDDSPAYPWNILFRLCFAGALCRELWQQAAASVLPRHPLLYARVRRTWCGRYRWHWPTDGASECEPLLHWNRHSLGIDPSLQRLPLEQGTAWETWAAVEGDRSEAVLHFHHAAVDGIAAARFISELLVAYDAHASGRTPQLPPLEPQRLARRDKYGYTPWKYLCRARKLSVGLAGVRQFIGRGAVSAVPHQPVVRSQSLPADYPATNSHVFGVAESQALRNAARSADTTLNNLLARDLFRALHRWRRELGLPGDDDQWLRISVPMNMRRPGDDSLPAANVASIVFLDRRSPQITAGGDTLLRGIHDEINLIKDNDLGMVFLLSLRASSILPGMLARAAKKQQFACAAAFSNLVRPLDGLPLSQDDGRYRVGPLRLDDFEFYPPVRPRTCVSIGVLSYADRLRICLQTDPRFVARPDAESLLATYVEEVRRSACAIAIA
ncbi:MAG: hypothetical protein QM775_14475 [Pirellulales bacterium]